MDETGQVNNNKTISEFLTRELDTLRSEYPEITSAAVVSADGFLMAVRPEGSADDKMAAMSAFLLNSAQKTGEGLGWSRLGYLMASHPDGYLLVAEAGKATLTLTTSPRAKLGLLLYDLKQSAAKLKDKLDGDF